MSDISTTDNQLASRPVMALTGAAAAVYTELYGQDGTTASKVALAAGVSPSAARKALATLEEQGLARRKPGGNDGTRRLADTWHAAVPAPAAGGTEPSAPDGGSPKADTAPTDGTAADGRTLSAGTGDTADTDGQADEHPADAHGGRESGTQADARAREKNASGAAETSVGATDRPDAPLSAVCPTRGHRRRAAAPRTTDSGTRLGSGQLHQMVLGHLREHDNEDWTATGIANAIGRSAGAIANALATMVSRGEAEQSCDKPRRYRATALVDAS